jgi:hypothetical protein
MAPGGRGKHSDLRPTGQAGSPGDAAGADRACGRADGVKATPNKSALPRHKDVLPQLIGSSSIIWRTKRTGGAPYDNT